MGDSIHGADTEEADGTDPAASLDLAGPVMVGGSDIGDADPIISVSQVRSRDGEKESYIRVMWRRRVRIRLLLLRWLTSPLLRRRIW